MCRVWVGEVFVMKLIGWECLMLIFVFLLILIVFATNSDNPRTGRHAASVCSRTDQKGGDPYP